MRKKNYLLTVYLHSLKMLQFPCHLRCFYVRDSDESHVPLPRAASPPPLKTGPRGARVRGAVLSAEMGLTRFISNITNVHVSWSEHKNGCVWSGVKCDSGSQVISLDWNSLALAGTFLYRHMPSTTKSFIVWRNDITGGVPLHEFPSSLEHINLSTNQLFGPLLTENLPRGLLTFYAATNYFSGEVGFTILPGALTSLGLAVNKFTGGVDLRSLPVGLVYLDLNHNHFTGDVCLSALPDSLEILYLHNNEFTGVLDTRHLPSGLKSSTFESNSFSDGIQ